MAKRTRLTTEAAAILRAIIYLSFLVCTVFAATSPMINATTITGEIRYSIQSILMNIPLPSNASGSVYLEYLNCVVAVPAETAQVGSQLFCLRAFLEATEVNDRLEETQYVFPSWPVIVRLWGVPDPHFPYRITTDLAVGFTPLGRCGGAIGVVVQRCGASDRVSTVDKEHIEVPLRELIERNIVFVCSVDEVGTVVPVPLSYLRERAASMCGMKRRRASSPVTVEKALTTGLYFTF